MAAAVKGGSLGSAIIPGNARASRVYQKVAGLHTPRMPLGGQLSAGETQSIKEWIDAGAQYPGNAPADAVWWSFGPVAATTPPKSADSWVRGPLDAFILARLREKGLAPNPRAKPAKLVRRVYLDLVGRPPTIEELSGFLRDPSPAGYEKAVDRLLASPEYGQRWASYWLDLARYAEDVDYHSETIPDAWRYRDYVIDSLNRDKPYDRFIREQIAGDELAPDDPSARTATAFLGLGPLTLRRQAILFRRQNRLNEITDTVGASMLGLTFGCARCHDHKTDPFTQKEYFQLQAYFAGVDMRPGIPLVEASKAEEYRRRQGEWERRTAQTRNQLQKLERPYRLRVLSQLNVPVEFLNLARAGSTPSAPLDRYVIASLERLTEPSDLRREILREAGARDVDAPYFSVTWGLLCALAVAGAAALTLRRKRSSWAWGTCAIAGLIVMGLSYSSARLMARSDISFLRTVPAAIELGRPPQRLPPSVAPAASVALRSLDQLLYGKVSSAVARRVGLLAFGYAPVALAAMMALAVGGLALRARSEDARERGGSSRRSLGRATPLAAFCVITAMGLAGTAIAAFPNRKLAQWRGVQLQLETFDRLKPPAVPTAYAACELGRSAPETRITGSGENLDTGDVVAPGVPAFLGSAPRIDPRSASSGRRAALAGWLTSKAYPLVARTIVNRVWQEHFGRGLSATTDDLGLAGERPSHPQLLEWLTSEFVRGGSSLKRLHRLIVTSAAYCQDSAFQRAAAQSDPDNTLLWRFSPRRLPAETLRDSILHTSGELDPTMGGPPVPGEPADLEAASKGIRRSIYVQVQRNAGYPMLKLLDAPDRRVTCARRQQTNTAAQAMLLFNSDFAHGRAQAFAWRLLDVEDDDRSRVTTAFKTAFCRPPAKGEINTALAFLRRVSELDGEEGVGAAGSHPAGGVETGKLRAYTAFCLALFNANEFAYVD